MSKGNLVSVVIPTIPKRKRQLENALMSVKKQTYSPIEIVVVNDDSISATQARNKGIERSNGDFIAFMDDDDEWMPGKIEEQMAVITAHPDCPLVVCYSRDLRFGQDKINMPYPVTSQKMMVNAFNFSSTSTYLVRTYPLSLIDGFDEALPSAQEYDLAIRLTQYHVARCVPNVLVTQNTTDGQISENWGKKKHGILMVCKKHRGLFKKASVLNGFKLWGLCIFFTFGFLFGNRIYWFLSPMKKRHEVC